MTRAVETIELRSNERSENINDQKSHTDFHTLENEYQGVTLQQEDSVEDVTIENFNKWKACGVVVGSFLGLTSNFGVINSIGVVQTYISEHQLSHVEASTISWIFSVYLYLSFSVGLIAGPIFVMKGTLPTLISGTVLVVGGFMGAANCKEVWQFVLCFLLVGTGHGLNITPLVCVVSQYWPQRYLGRASSCATIGGSIGGIVWPLLLRSLYPKIGFAWGTRILAFMCLFCMISSIVLAKERYRKNLFSFVEDEGNDKVTSKRKLIGKAGKNILTFGALKDAKYTFLICGVFFGGLSLVLTSTYYASYARAQGMSESSSYLLLTIFNAAGIVGRYVPGHMADLWGPLNIMILMLSLSVISILVVWLPFGKYKGVLYAFSVLIGAFSAGIFSLIPTSLRYMPVYIEQKIPSNLPDDPFSDNVTTERTVKVPIEFGQKYGLLYFFASIGNLIGIPIASAVIGNGSQYNYSMFVVLTGCSMSLSVAFWCASRFCLVGKKFLIRV
ncbi:Piso0_001879 [Millerozyma farinosa CBS 7064]|uniref:Piso0_001879 protein n=1 Tax=Pichia sorbitophila (strain ATCC MYA-4447 / BCRC 22081 / CBS 7064 / NBRC 10061 / NRRL Y-12695) TaxID=559304 RepID=G8YPB6_PICSO|nr:Piso0_001879 [Millerozyma farinosa CBS 7064]